MLASIIINCIGMVTVKEDLALFNGLYIFSCNLGHVIYLSVFASITDGMSMASYDSGLGFLVGVSVVAFVFTGVLYVVDGKKGWILNKLEQKRN